MRAVLTSARLTIWIPLPVDARERREAELQRAIANLDQYPEFTPARIKDRELEQLEKSLDWGAIRDEFQRKAKKLEFKGKPPNFPVEIFDDSGGLTLQVSYFKS